MERWVFDIKAKIKKRADVHSSRELKRKNDDRPFLHRQLLG